MIVKHLKYNLMQQDILYYVYYMNKYINLQKINLYTV